MDNIRIEYKKQIEELVQASHRIAELGYVTSAGGNLSVRVAENLILITPTKTPKRTLRFEDICAVDLWGNTVFAPEGKKPTGETAFHVRIMRRRSDIQAIVHAHPPIMTGFAIANSELLAQPFLPEPITEIGPILMVPYETPLTEKLSEQFDRVIDRTNGFLMENHGALFASINNIFEAVECLQMAESMAQSVLVAMQLGNCKPIPAYHVKEMDSVIETRNLTMPGAKGKYKSASELYELQ